MLPRKFQLSDRMVVKNIFKDLLSIFLSKPPPPPLWSYSTPGDDNLNNLEYTLPEDASSDVTAFLARYLMRRTF